MRSTGAILLALSAIAVAGGCGGSSSSSSASGTQSTRSTRATGKTTSPGSGLSVIKPPKYASPPPGSPVRSGVVQIEYRNITIKPDALRVRVGSTLVWTNFDAVKHNVTSRSGPQAFASGNLSPGSSFRVRVQRPGIIHYLCTIHPVTMNGTIEVVS